MTVDVVTEKLTTVPQLINKVTGLLCYSREMNAGSASPLPASLLAESTLGALNLRDQRTDLRSILRRRKPEILRLAEQHGARRVRLFGSAARGETHDASDLDLLVEMEEGRSLLDRIAFQQDVQDLLGVAVDVVTEKALHPVLRPHVLEEALEL